MIMLMVPSPKESLVHQRRGPKLFLSLATVVSGKRTIATGSTQNRLLNHTTNATPARNPSKERTGKSSAPGNKP